MHLYLNRFVCWVHYCSKLCQSSPWKPRREASHFQNCQIQTPSLSQKNQSLIKPLLKNSFSTNFPRPCLDQERLHFTLVGLFAGFTIAASCARAAPGSPEEKQAFSKGNCQIQTPSLSQRSHPLLNPYLKNSFSTIFQGPGPGEASFHFSLFAGFTIAASCARAAPGSPEEKQAFSKGNCQIQTPSLSQRSQSLIKPLLKNSFSTIFQGPGPGEAPFHFSRFVCWVHYCSKLCQSSPEAQKRSKPFPKAIAKFKLQAFPKGANPLIKPLLKNSFSTIFQGPGPGEAPFHFSRFVCWVHYCSKLCQSSPWKPEEKQAFSKGNCQIQTPSLSQRSQSLIKPLLKNSFSTIFQGPGPGEAPFHFSRFVCWVHYCSKLCQSSSWKPRREASLFQSNCQIQLQAFPKGANPLLNPY